MPVEGAVSYRVVFKALDIVFAACINNTIYTNYYTYRTYVL